MDVETGRSSAYSERATIPTGCFDAIDWIAGRYPTVRANFQRLATHDKKTAEHEMRVTMDIATAALRHGYDARLAALAGFTHDFGKMGVPDRILKSHLLAALLRGYTRTKHMKVTRTILTAVPDEELFPIAKDDLLAVVMAHHEILPNGHKTRPYPRKHPREALSNLVITTQAFLALSDRADRIAWGYFGDRPQPFEIVLEKLGALARNAQLPFTPFERDGYVHTIAQTACATTPAMVERAMEIVGCPSEAPAGR